MNSKNEYIEPGTYEHYKGGMYVVMEVITHMENPDIGKMDKLQDPLVVYRDLIPVPDHVNGKPEKEPYKRYARKLSEFQEKVLHNDQTIKRFTKI